MIRTLAYEAMNRLASLGHEIRTVQRQPTAIGTKRPVLQQAVEAIDTALNMMAVAYAESIQIETDPANKEISI